MKNINCILFDLDGTLLDTYNLVIKSFQHTIRQHYDKELKAEEILPYFGEPLWVTMERFSKEEAQELIKTYRKFNLAHHDELTVLFPGVRETLEAISAKGIPIGIVTSKVKLTAHRGVELFSLKDLINVFISLEDCTNHKPHPEPILKALEVLGITNRENVLMVGDSPFDIQCAKNAGVKSAAVSWSIIPPEVIEAEKPDYIIHNFQDLLTLI